MNGALVWGSNPLSRMGIVESPRPLVTAATCCSAPRTSLRCASCGENSFTTTSRPGASTAAYVAVAPPWPSIARMEYLPATT